MARAMGTRTASYSRTDAALGSQPDGTPGNPPGTMVSRGVDEVAGTNISGAHPENEHGTPRNPPGTAAERAVDRTFGTNTSGANPDRMPRR